MVVRVSEDREFKIQAFTIVLGTFFALLAAAMFEGKYWLAIEVFSVSVLGLLIIYTKKSIINLSENGPMKEVSGKEAIRWGVFYMFFGIGLLVFYYFT